LCGRGASLAVLLDMRGLAVSVGRRIAFLIIAQTFMIGILISHVFRALSNLAEDLDYSERYILTPAESLPEPLERVATIKAELEFNHREGHAPRLSHLEPQLDEVEHAIHHYRTTWMVADRLTADARRFREELDQADKLALLDDERAAVERLATGAAELRKKLNALDTPEGRVAAIDEVTELKRAFRALLRTNIEFIAVDHEVQEARAQNTRTTLVAISLASLVMSILLGLHIRNAIGPRITTMARKVRTFQETGDFERTANPGSDEIAVLSNALDAGFSAIRERDRDRERFLAVAAHELKTPLTSIVGFVDAALASPDTTLRQRALEVIRRQAGRLGRLVQDLLWAANARYGHLAFHPKPTDSIAIIQKTLGEIEEGQRFVFTPDGPAYLLADEDLLGHALWQVLSYGIAIAEKGTPVRVQVVRSEARVALEVTIAKIAVPFDEIERAFLPFTSIQYEGGGLRYAVGLYLSREIARLHGGTLQAFSDGSGGAVFRLELPA
jgi:signal transduction histidine kinase